MVGNFVNLLLKRTAAPQWFYFDRKHGIAENEIKEKIRAEIYEEVVSGYYNQQIWTDEFITKISNLYYKFFNQLYMQSA